jgi:hypothetical protein
MNTYKITNLTDQLHKRDVHFKTPVKIQYINNRVKKTVEIKTGENLFLSVESLPLSIHRLRIKGLISVIEVNTAEIKKMTTPTPSKKVSEKPKTEAPKPKTTSSSRGSKKTTSSKSSPKKRSYNKSTSSTSKSSSTSNKTDSTERESTI